MKCITSAHRPLKSILQQMVQKTEVVIEKAAVTCREDFEVNHMVLVGKVSSRPTLMNMTLKN